MEFHQSALQQQMSLHGFPFVQSAYEQVNLYNYHLSFTIINT